MLSIIVGAVVLFAFGALWFTVLFGKTWEPLQNFTPEVKAKMQNMGMAKPLVLNFLTVALTSIVVYYLFPQLLAISYADFLKVILIIWLGFSFPIYANGAIWEGKSWKLVLLNSVYGILASSIISAVIYFMQ